MDRPLLYIHLKKKMAGGPDYGDRQHLYYPHSHQKNVHSQVINIIVYYTIGIHSYFTIYE